MERVLVMTAQITIEFNGGHELNGDGEKWKEASHIFADALKVFLPNYLTRLEKVDNNLENIFETSRGLGCMEAGYEKVKFKLYAKRHLDITFNDDLSRIRSLVDATSRELLPIFIAVGIIFQTPKLTVKYTKTGQAPQAKEIDLLSCFAKEEK